LFFISDEDVDKNISAYFGLQAMSLDQENKLKLPQTPSDKHTLQSTSKHIPSNKHTLQSTPNHKPSSTHTPERTSKHTLQDTPKHLPSSNKHTPQSSSKCTPSHTHTLPGTPNNPLLSNKHTPQNSSKHTPPNNHTHKNITKRTPLNMHTKKHVTPRSSGVKRPLSKIYIDSDTSDSDVDNTDEPISSSTPMAQTVQCATFLTPNSKKVSPPQSAKYIDFTDSDEDHTPVSPHISDTADSSDSDNSMHAHTLTPLLPLQHLTSHLHNPLTNQTAGKCPRTVPIAPLCTQVACVNLHKENQVLKEQIGLLRANNTRLQREIKGGSL